MEARLEEVKNNIYLLKELIGAFAGGSPVRVLALPASFGYMVMASGDEEG